MKLKTVTIIIVTLSISVVAFAGVKYSKGEFFARRNPRQEAIIKKQKKGREVRRRNRTMFANKSIDSVRANQILLTTKKERISIE